MDSTEGKNESEVTAFLRDAFSDYLAARVLLLNDVPEQGAILCSTAIEKCAKAMLAHRGEKLEKEHLGAEHRRILGSNPNFGASLNQDFLQVSQLAYKLRYTRDLPINYSVVIASREFLAEMDHTIQTVLSCFQCHVNGARRLTGYEDALARRDQRLVAENHLLTGQPVVDFVLLKPQSIYEVRRHQRFGVMEARYSTTRPAKRGGFLRAALVTAQNQLDCDLSCYPLPGSLSLVVDGVVRLGRELNGD
jgi:hypothetical protein